MTPFPDDHRPWPVPRRPWVMAQTWRQLLFAHWPVPVEALWQSVPAQIPVDTYEGQAWIAVVPFDLSVIRPRAVPPVPIASRFLELNVRTYVTVGGKPGVYFFSLDAGNPLAVAGARLMHINYFYAWMGKRQAGNRLEYWSRRLQPLAAPAEFSGWYRPVSAFASPVPGTLVHWLTERYCLYAVNPRGRVSRLEIHHPPWRLAQAEARLRAQGMVDQIGLRLPDVEPLLHYAEQQDMVAWMPEPVG